MPGNSGIFGLIRSLGNLFVRKGSGEEVGPRRRLRLNEGSNVTLTVTEDDANDEAVVTIAATGGGGVTDGDKGDITVSGGGTTWTIDNGVVNYANIQDVTDARLLGRSAGSDGPVHEITVGAGLSLSGGALTNTGGTYTDEQAQDAVGSILTDSASVDLTYNDVANTITATVLPAGIDHGGLGGLGDDDHTQYLRTDGGRAWTGHGNANNFRLANVLEPSAEGHAATYGFVLAGDWKNSVRVATTTNITLSGEQTIDGVSVVAGNRVLVKEQGAGSQNGIWVASASGWSRPDDAGSSARVTSGMTVFVEEGAIAGGSIWSLTTTGTITLNTTALAFTQMDGATERMQDVVGAMLVDSSSIDFTYTDGSGTFTAGIKPAGVTSNMIRDSAALSIIGRSANSTGVPADIVAANDGEVLRRAGTTLGFGPIATAGIGDAQVTPAKISDRSACSLFGRSANSSGVGADIALGADGEIAARLGGAVDGYQASAFTAIDAALDDEALVGDTSAGGATRKLALNRLLGLLRIAPGGRPTLTSGTPVTTSDVTGASTIYYTPFESDIIQLWDGTRWLPVQFSETSHTLSSLTSGVNYDVFGYLSSGALALERLAWTNDTTRATAVTYQDGRLCKSGDKTRLYLFSFRATGTTTTEDSDGKRFLWSMYNRVPRRLKKIDSTDSWNYTTATFRSARGSDDNRVELITGDPSLLDLEVLAIASNSAGGVILAAGIDEDGTSGNDADLIAGNFLFSSNTGVVQVGSTMKKYPTVGYHFYQWTEYSGAVGTTSWRGDSAATTLFQSGLLGWIMG